MTTTGGMTPIKVSGPAGLLAAVPPMLGFHPTNSLVLMCLSGDRRRVGPVARVDLPAGHDRAMARQLTAHARNHADEVVVISYQDSRRRPPLLDDMLAELDRAGVAVMDAIVVRGGRARPGISAAVERVHPGVPVPDADDPQVAALTAAGALAGRSVLASRDDLRRSIAGPTGKRLQMAEHAVDMALAGLIDVAERSANQHTPEQPGTGSMTQPGDAGRDDAAGGDSPAPRRHLQRLPEEVTNPVDRAFAQVVATGTVDLQVSIDLAMDLIDVVVRNAVLVRAVTELDEPWLPTLIACATWTPDYLAPDLCAVLSVVAYRHGDGALAQLAVDRCLHTEPGHPVARWMIRVMAAGFRPEELERAIKRTQGPEHLFCDDHPVAGYLDDDLDDDDLYDADLNDDDLDDEASTQDEELWWGR